MNTKLQNHFFVLIFIISGVLCFFIFQPFLITIALALFFALVFRPLYKKIKYVFGSHERLAALSVVFIVSLCILIPLLILGNQVVKEVQEMYIDVRDISSSKFEGTINTIESNVQTVIPQFSLNLPFYTEQLYKWLSSQTTSFIFGTISGIFHILLGMVLFYYFLYNGANLKKQLVALSPLPDAYDQKLLRTIDNVVNSIMKGTLLVAIIQGLLVGIGLWIFKVPQATLGGVLGVVAALIPGVGTALILIPAIIYLVVVNKLLYAFGLAVWGVMVVGLIDNILIPLLYGKNIQVHPVFVLMAVLGGLALFGASGFIFGPLILSLFLVLLHIYQFSINRSRKIS